LISKIAKKRASMFPVSQRAKANSWLNLDLLCQLAHIAASDAELVVSGTVLGILRTHLLAAEYS